MYYGNYQTTALRSAEWYSSMLSMLGDPSAVRGGEGREDVDTDDGHQCPHSYQKVMLLFTRRHETPISGHCRFCEGTGLDSVKIR